MYNPEDVYDVISLDDISDATTTHFRLMQKAVNEKWSMDVTFRRFADIDVAQTFLTRLTNIQDPRVALFYPIFTIKEVPGSYFIATRRPAKTLGSLVGNASKAQKLYSGDGHTPKVMYSDVYRGLIRDVLEVSITMRASGLSCILGLENVEIFEEQGHVRLRFTEFEDKLQNDEDDKDKIATFIELLNNMAHITFQEVLSFEELDNLIRQLRGPGVLNEDIFKIPLFFNPKKRGDFICALSSYLETHPNVIFSNVQLESCYYNWEAKVHNDAILNLLKYQDGVDRVTYNAKTRIDTNLPPYQYYSTNDKNEIHVRNWLDFIRQVFIHLLRMSISLIACQKMRHRIDIVDVDMLFNKVFPNYVERLVTRVKDLRLLEGGGFY